MLDPDQVVAGRYRIEQPLGRGGAAQVYRAQDLELERAVALKFLDGRGTVSDPARLEEEARALARLRHPHILEVYDVVRAGSMLFLVLELVDGGTLFEWSGTNLMPQDRLQVLARKLISALAYAHEAGILHRDIKPENVLLTRSGEPKLADFGLAKRRGKRRGVRTDSGVILGTPEFMAPEVLRGEVAGAPADVYAWGCLVYMMVNGRPPFVGDFQTLVRAHLGDTPRPGRERPPLAEALHGALGKDPVARPTAAALELALAEAPGTESESQPLPRPRLTTQLGAATRAPTASHYLPRPGARRVAGAVAVMALLGLGLRGLPGAGETSTGYRPLLGGRPRAGLVERWRRRLEGVDAAQLLATLHRRAMPPGTEGSYIRAMAQARDGSESGVLVGALEGARAELPAWALFQEDRRELAAFLESRDGDPHERLELYQSLAPLACIDHYFEAWGRTPPYGVEAVRQRLVALELTPARPRAEAPEPPPPAPSDTATTKRLPLFRWTHPDDRAYPWLSPAVGDAHHDELASILVVQSTTQERWRLEDHLEVRGAVDLGRRPRERYQRAVLRFEVGNLLPPNFLRVEWNGRPLDVFLPPRLQRHRSWTGGTFPQFRVGLHLPRELLLGGVNHLRATVQVMPGLPRRYGTEVDGFELELATMAPGA